MVSFPAKQCIVTNANRTWNCFIKQLRNTIICLKVVFNCILLCQAKWFCQILAQFSQGIHDVLLFGTKPKQIFSFSVIQDNVSIRACNSFLYPGQFLYFTHTYKHANFNRKCTYNPLNIYFLEAEVL